MCTSISYKSHYFGRNLDYEVTYNNDIVITPKNFVLKLNNKEQIKNKYAIIGMGIVEDNFPLYFDAMNEMGLAIAGLQFSNFAEYKNIDNNKYNLTSFELIPYILGNFSNILQLKEFLKKLNITNISFNKQYPTSPLHWCVNDANGNCIVIEQTKDGLNIYDNEIFVLTNAPEFKYHKQRFMDFSNLSIYQPSFNKTDNFNLYSRGMGAIGLPGDYSSSSRFNKAAFVLKHSISENNEIDNVTQFFHILNSVEQVKGCVNVKDNLFEYTIYSSCMSFETLTYYYKTYNNNQINAVKLTNELINSDSIKIFKIIDKQNINYQN